MINILVSIAGFFVISSELEKNLDELHVSSRNKNIVVTFLGLLILILNIFFRNSLQHWFVLSGILLLSVFCRKIIVWRLESLIYQAFQVMLDELILGVQSGKSVVESLEMILRFRSGWEFYVWRELYDVVRKKKVLETISSAKKREIFLEIVTICSTQSRVLDQLKSLRHFVKKQNEFRRRSGAVTQQMRAQSFLLTIIFIGCCIFTTKKYGLFEHWKLLFLSSILFLSGMLLQFLILKRQSWKI